MIVGRIYESEADHHRQLAERAGVEANVKQAREQLLIAEAHLIRAQAELAKYTAKENH